MLFLETEVSNPIKYLSNYINFSILKINYTNFLTKYLSNNFWRSPDSHLSKCKIDFDLINTKKICNIWNIYSLEAAANPDTVPPNPYAARKLASDTKLQINSAKVYDPVVTFSIKNNIKLWENLK